MGVGKGGGIRLRYKDSNRNSSEEFWESKLEFTLWLQAASTHFGKVQTFADEISHW